MKQRLQVEEVFFVSMGSSIGVGGITPDDAVMPGDKFDTVETDDLEVSWRKVWGGLWQSVWVGCFCAR
jgi:hypothetical protein